MKDRKPPEQSKESGLLSLLEKEEAATAETVKESCIRINESIYQCLNDCSCRSRFSYGSIALCSWPRPDNPNRTMDTLPCNSTDDDRKNSGE